MPIQRLLLLALLFVIACSLVEALVLARRRAYDWRSMGVSLFNATGRMILTAVLPLSLAAPVFDFAWTHRLATIDLGLWSGIAALFIGQEFFYYCYHRAAHRVRWFWCNHAVHHSPNDLTLATAYRTGMFAKLIGAPLFFAPLVWIGFPTQVVLATLALNLLYQFWIHVTWIPRLGWLEYVFNTPSAHRVHHAANPEYLDANYGGVLTIFDRLFGTYVAERDDLPCRYGLTDPITSYNPLRVEFREWGKLLADLRGARSVSAFCGYLLMPPGWRPAPAAEAVRSQSPS
jgi:sterol desaturase/sphingolipid hydroxylase (fatty acid hydroxylase superfamily)